jgi:hypothetical protein
MFRSYPTVIVSWSVDLSLSPLQTLLLLFLFLIFIALLTQGL